MLQLLIVHFVVAANLLLAFMLLKKSHHSATHLLISALSLIFSAWTVCNYFALLPGDNQLFWVRSVMVVTSPAGALIFLLANVFPGRKIKMHSGLVIMTILSTLIAVILSATPFVFITLIKLTEDSFRLIPGPGIALYGANLLIFTTLGLLLLVRKMKSSGGIQQRQFMLVVTGIVVCFALMIATNFLAVVLFQSVRLTVYGPMFTLIMTGSMTYAILKYQFLDIKQAIAKSVSFSMLIGVIALFYSGVIFVLTRFLLEESISAQATAVSAVIALPLLLSFDKLKKYIQKATESFFFKYSYELESTVHDLAQILSSTIRMQAMLRQVIRTLTHSLKTNSIKIAVKNKRTFALYSNEEASLQPKNSKQLQLLAHQAHKQESNVLFLDYLEEGEQKQLLRELELELVIALETEGELLGGIFLSSKSSGDPYFPQDIQLLNIFAPQLSVAIQNSLSYEEIQQFNVTLRKKITEATKELKKANRQLQELDQLKDDFVSVTSHELRTPMTAIRSYLWMVLDGKAGTISTKQRYYLERSYASAERLIKLVNDMLNISRIESGRLSLDFQQVSLRGLCLEVISELQPRADELGLLLELKTDNRENTKLSYLVAASGDRIKEVLINFIGNSIKFTEKGGKITVKLEEVHDHVTVEVTDTGVGMNQKDLSSLFQKFGFMKGSYRTNQDASQGTGLGLYIAKTIIDYHQGKIWAKSKGKGKGSTFGFSLPSFSYDLLRMLKDKKTQRKRDLIK